MLINRSWFFGCSHRQLIAFGKGNYDVIREGFEFRTGLRDV